MSEIDFAKVRHFLTNDALPFWNSVGRYDNGCFVEHLDLVARPVDPGFTRTRVQSRQLYVFCHAHLAGLGDFAESCRGSAEFLISSAWQGPAEGWAKLLDRHGAVLDGSYDFYDVSFALFAAGWYYKVSGDPQFLAIAHATLDYLERHAAHPAGGFRNDASDSQPRQQNPHMHLVEALNVWFDATGDDRFGGLATTIIDLFASRFCDPASGVLREFFNDDWTVLDGPAGEIVEPGHQFEWAWIIGHNGQMTNRHRPDLMGKLIDCASRAGYNAETGLTVDQVRPDGSVLAASRRLWPQTESIKASLAAREFLGIDTNERLARTLNSLFRIFLDPAPVPGTWIDHFDVHGTIIVDKIPASSLYHLTLAFVDLLRLQPLLTGLPDVVQSVDSV